MAKENCDAGSLINKLNSEAEDRCEDIADSGFGCCVKRVLCGAVEVLNLIFAGCLLLGVCGLVGAILFSMSAVVAILIWSLPALILMSFIFSKFVKGSEGGVKVEFSLSKHDKSSESGKLSESGKSTVSDTVSGSSVAGR